MARTEKERDSWSPADPASIPRPPPGLLRRGLTLCISAGTRLTILGTTSVTAVTSVISALSRLFTFLLSGAAVFALGFSGWLLAAAVNQDTLTISPFSVPNAWTERGYSGFVIAERIRDSMQRIALEAEADPEDGGAGVTTQENGSLVPVMQPLTVSLKTETPNITVPTIGVSLETVASAVRTYLGVGNARLVTGDLADFNGELSIRVRMDGQMVLASDAGLAQMDPEYLIERAAHALVDATNPYLLAVIAHRKNEQRGYEMAGSIIRRRPPNDENVIQARILQGVIHLNRKEFEQAEQILRPLAQLEGQVATPRNVLALAASVNLGVALGQMQKHADAIALYDDLDRRFGTSADRMIRVFVASARVDKAYRLVRLGRAADAIALYDRVDRDFGSQTTQAMQAVVADAMLGKGLAYGELGQTQAELASYDALVRRFGASHSGASRKFVFWAMVNKGLRLGALGRVQEAIAVYDDLIARFDIASEPVLRDLVAKALFTKGLRLAELDRGAEATAAYDDLIARFGTSPQGVLAEIVALARQLKERAQAAR